MIKLRNTQDIFSIINTALPILSAKGEVCLAMSASGAGKSWKIKYFNTHDLPGKFFNT